MRAHQVLPSLDAKHLFVQKKTEPRPKTATAPACILTYLPAGCEYGELDTTVGDVEIDEIAKSR